MKIIEIFEKNLSNFGKESIEMLKKLFTYSKSFVECLKIWRRFVQFNKIVENIKRFGEISWKLVNYFKCFACFIKNLLFCRAGKRLYW